MIDTPLHAPTAPTDASPLVRPSFVVSLAGGVVAAAVALGVGELVAGLDRRWRSPVLDVGDRVIDAVPAAVKDLAIETFGTNDKLALLVGIGALVAVAAMGIGVVAIRTGRLRAGLVGIGLFGLVGGWAARSRRVATPWLVVVPSLAGAAAGAAVMWLLHRLTRAASSCPDAAVADDAPRRDRRQFLGATSGVLAVLAGSTAVASAAAVLGRRLTARFSAADSRAAVALPPPTDRLPPLPLTVEVGVAGMPPFVTPNASFYRIDTALSAPQVPTESYSLRIHGMVDRELVLSYDELLARPMIERDITMVCVSNEIGGSLVGHARWLGTRLDDLLREAGAQVGADQIVGRSADGFECGFPVANALDGRDALVVVGMNGEPLPIEHGFPVRLVVPGLYGYVSATKWLTEIELTTFTDFDHYWRRRGWAARAPIKLMSRIDVPRGLATVPAGTVAVAGVAYAPTVGIGAVEVQVDDGEWQRAELANAPSADTWVQWRVAWNAAAGRHQVRVRAIDANGAIQIATRAEPIPDGATGLHQIVVIVE